LGSELPPRLCATSATSNAVAWVADVAGVDSSALQAASIIAAIMASVFMLVLPANPAGSTTP